MTYDSLKALVGKESVTIVEIDLDSCSNTYGSAPCTASGLAALKCFNTYGTCQDTANFTKTTKTFRLSDRIIDGVQAAGDAPTFPTITGISHSPTQLTPSKGLGIRATVKVQLTDHPWSDVGVDPYLSDRTYDPEERSTFWGKMLARQKYYEGRTMRVKQGYLDDGAYDAANFSTRQYIISKISGPTPDGKITIEGKDPLKFADNSRVQFPAPTDAELSADITSGATSVAITDTAGIISAAYSASPSQPWIRIDDEIMEVTGVTGTGPAYTLTVTRGTAPSFYSTPSVADAHDDEATVQSCYLYEDIPVDDIFYHLLVTVSGISSSYIDTAAWQAKMDFGYSAYTFSTLLTEPIGVQDLLKELTEHTFLLWWNERTQKIELDTLIRRVADYGPFTDGDSFISGSTSVGRDTESRLSRIYFYYGHRNPTLDMDNAKYFERIEADIDLTMEGANAYDNTKIRSVYSRWLPTAKRAVVSEITTRLLNEYKNTKTIITYKIDPKDDDAWTGDIVSVTTRQVVDNFGVQQPVDFRILQVSENHSPKGITYTYVGASLGEYLRLAVITPTLDGGSPFPVYSAASDAQRLAYAFISPDSGVFDDGGNAYTIR
jgi:hypothetical protein